MITRLAESCTKHQVKTKLTGVVCFICKQKHLSVLLWHEVKTLGQQRLALKMNQVRFAKSYKHEPSGAGRGRGVICYHF